MGAFQPWHWVVIAVVVLLLFGAKRLPDAARSLGRSMRILKAETKGLRDDDPKAKAEAQSSHAVIPPRDDEPSPMPTPSPRVDARDER